MSLQLLSFMLILYGTLHTVCTDCKSWKMLRLLMMIPKESATSRRETVNRHESQSSTDLYNLPDGGESAYYPHFDAAVELINNSSNLLPCHNLTLVYRDDGCSDTRSRHSENLASSLVSGLFPRDSESRVVGILGPACLESARKVVYVADKPEIDLIVLHTGGSLMLGRDTKNSLDILGSSRPLLFHLYLTLIEESGWKSICVLYDSNSHYYHDLKDGFLHKLHPKGVRASVVVPVSSSFYALDEIRNSGVRIVFIFASAEHVRRLLCLAYHMNLIYPMYQWIVFRDTVLNGIDSIITGVFTFIYGEQTYTCLSENLMHAVEQSFVITFQVITNSETEVKSNSDREELGNIRSAAAPILTSMSTIWVYSIYNGLWAWATVLHNLLSVEHEVVFDYGNASLTDLILEQFNLLYSQHLSSPSAINSGVPRILIKGGLKRSRA